jgi:ADP-dependent NAD(P)H-hydrate dehydratase / NAD(P)H-hydrate epimerase
LPLPSCSASLNARLRIGARWRLVHRWSAQAILARWAPRPVLVLCGPGNNGGDGFVVAQALNAAGWPVTLGTDGALDDLPEPARSCARATRVPVQPLEVLRLVPDALVVDAMFGAGLNRPFDGPAARLLQEAGRAGLPIVAVDVPSGLHGDSGHDFGATAATLTVTFFRRKPAHVLARGRQLCGTLLVADIGIPASVLDHLLPDTFANGPELWARDRGVGRALPAAWELRVPEGTDDSADDPLAAARLSASRSGRILLLGGTDPLIVTPDGQVIIHPVALSAIQVPEVQMALVAGLAGWTRGRLPLHLALARALWQALPGAGAQRYRPD